MKKVLKESRCIISLFFMTLTYELWRIKQYFLFRPNSLYVKTPELLGIIKIMDETKEIEVYLTYSLFKKAWLNKEIFLNNHKGILKINYLLNIVAEFPTIIPQEEWSNLDLEY